MDYLSVKEWTKVASAFLGHEVYITDYCVKSLNAMGGFMGDHHLATVTVRGLGQEIRTLNFFLKGYPNALESQKEIANQAKGFQKEVEVLSILFPKIIAALNDKSHTVKWTCKCLFTRPDVIILEDLYAQGCITIGNREPIDYKHMKIAMTSLANMHAASIIYEETRDTEPYRLDNDYPFLMKEGFFQNVPNHPGKQYIDASVDVVWALVGHIRGKDALDRMKHDLKEAINLVFEFQSASKIFRNVMCHGDVKRDNIFFRYENDEPVEAIFVDFQLMRYSPPANDVISFLYLATDRKFREEYCSKLLEHYYNHLSLTLKQYLINPDEILPWKSFEESCKVYKTLGIIIAACYLPFVYFKAEHISHVFKTSDEYGRFLLKNRVPEVMNAFRTDELFKEIVTDVIDELIEEYIEKKSHLISGK